MTNLPKRRFSAREIAALYTARWSIETIFQESKSVFGLDEIPVRRKDAVECFMLAAVVMVLLSRHVLGQIRAGLGSARKGPMEEETETQPMAFSQRLQWFSTDILEMLAEQLGYSWEPGKVIIEGAIDRNVDRYGLTERVAYGVVGSRFTDAGELATLRPG